MDRRREKTSAAIYAAFTGLLEQKDYARITVQEIIDVANVGRTTFYSHFETKDDLLRSMCEELFRHVFDSAKQHSHFHEGHVTGEDVFAHLLWHLREDDRAIRTLLVRDTTGTAAHYFREGVQRLIEEEMPVEKSADLLGVPKAYLVDQLTSSYVATVKWWMEHGMREEPDVVRRNFRAVTNPLLAHS
jgi:AcrR family transcriptional regulator